MADPQLPAGYTLDGGSTRAPAVQLPTGYTLDKPAAPADPSLLDKAVNYHTGLSAIDAPLGLAQGALKGAISTVYGARDLANKIPGVKQATDAYERTVGISPAEQASTEQAIQAPRQSLTTPSGIGQGTGKFLEQAAEYALPATEAAGLTKGAGLLARAGTQAAVGAGVSGAQTGGDPASMAVGGVLGGAGEVAGAAVTGAKKMLSAAKSPTLANFAESFGNATPLQKAKITQALPTLIKDGIVPADDVHDTQDMVKGKLADLSQAYQNLDPAIKARETTPDSIIQGLKDAQQRYMSRGVVIDDASHGAIQNQIGKVQAIADANGGKINLDDIVKLKQNANGKTTWDSPKAEQDLWQSMGDVFRDGSDTLAKEVTPLNQDLQHYSTLERVIDQNIERGKGTTPSGLDALKNTIVQHAASGTAAATLGTMAGGPVVGTAAGLAGTIIGPKVSKAAAQAIQNAFDSGAFASLAPVKQSIVKAAAKMGDNAAILKVLGVSGTTAASEKIVAKVEAGSPAQ